MDIASSTVLSVVDGDTITASTEAKQELKIRLLYVGISSSPACPSSQRQALTRKLA